jgi:hypothetical protein
MQKDIFRAFIGVWQQILMKYLYPFTFFDIASTSVAELVVKGQSTSGIGESAE